MTDRETRVARLAERNKTKLKEMLSNELGDAYSEPVPEKLLNSFLRAAFERINPDVDPLNMAQSHQEFDDSWTPKRRLATALRMLLADYGVRRPGTPLMRLDQDTLAQLIVAIRLRDEGRSPSKDERGAIVPPERPQPPESEFSARLSLADADQKQMRDWVENRTSLSNANYAVYVLDCTPLIGEERESVRSLRARASEKLTNGVRLNKIEEAAAALNNGKRIYYVGFTNDVVDRVGRHLGGAAKGSGTFTHTFPPQYLVEVRWFEYERDARSAERQRASDLSDENSFGYWN